MKKTLCTLIAIAGMGVAMAQQQPAKTMEKETPKKEQPQTKKNTKTQQKDAKVQTTFRVQHKPKAKLAMQDNKVGKQPLLFKDGHRGGNGRVCNKPVQPKQ